MKAMLRAITSTDNKQAMPIRWALVNQTCRGDAIGAA
jgi:hypothetical protein